MKYTSKGPLSINELIKKRELKYNITKEKLIKELNLYTFEEVAQKYNLSSNMIRKWCDDYEISRYAKDYGVKKRNKNKYTNIKEIKTILQIDKNTDEIINEFNSIKEASLYLKANPVNITKVLNKKERQKTAYGYKWKYK